MPNDNSWPRVRALLDEAVQSPRGIVALYDNWSTAERVRANIYKIREMQRRESRKMYPDPLDPSHGVSTYDGLAFWLRSTVARKTLNVHFHSAEELDELSALDLLEPVGKREENQDLFPGKCVTLTLETPQGIATISHAPSFKVAWEILRLDFPTELIIENGYSLDGMNIRQL